MFNSLHFQKKVYWDYKDYKVDNDGCKACWLSGWIQTEGTPSEEVRPGDVIWIEPNEKHWHGGMATNGMTQIAIQENLNGKIVEWMEKVTDKQYEPNN